MIKETVTAIGITHIVTETGSKTCLGNRQFAIGESVWTHEGYAFGTERNSGILIIPTGMVPAVGRFIVEFYKSDGVFRIRDTESLDVVVEVEMPTEVADAWPGRFCYDVETLAFYVIAEGPSSNGYRGVTIHKVQNGSYTTETVNLPTGGFFSYNIMHAVNGQLYWTVFANDFVYRKHTTSAGVPFADVSGVIAFYEYIGTELQNTYNLTSRVTSFYDAIWETINTAWNGTTLTLTEVNETTSTTQGTPPGYSDTTFEFDVLKGPAYENDGTTLIQLGTYSASRNQYYPITGYGAQYPRITTASVELISFEEKMIAINAEATCYLYVSITPTSGDYPARNCVKEPVGRLSVRDAAIIDDTQTSYICNINTGDANYQGTYGVNNLEAGTSLIKSYSEDTNEYSMAKCGLSITYSGANSTVAQSKIFSWQKPFEYGYFADIDLTVSWNNRLVYSTSAQLNDGDEWTMDYAPYPQIEYEADYAATYPDFMSLDKNGNILYYSALYGEFYKIDKATKALTLIHDDALYSQMQMPFIEKSQSEIVSALTVS